jgi:hypothetical protein
MSALDDVRLERERQVSVEGWSAAHDAAHSSGELALAGSCYALVAGVSDAERSSLVSVFPPRWPWSPSWWKPKDRRRDLVRAAALIVAELERMDAESSSS